MTLRVRLAVVFGALGLAAIATMAAVSWFLAASEVRGSIDEELRSRASLVDVVGGRGLATAPIAPDPVGVTAGASRLGVLQGEAESGFQIFDRSGQPLAGDALVPLDLDAAGASAAEPSIETVRTPDAEYRVITVAIDADDIRPIGYIQVFRDVTDEEGALDQLATRLVLAAASSILLVLVASWWVGRRLSRPLDELTHTASQLAELEDLPARIEIGRSDEIGRLADSFNRVLSALEVAREQQRRLVADASHELRTPLTSLRMRIEFLAADTDLGPDERRAHQDRAVAEVEQLSALVGELVDLAADARAGDEEPERVVLADLVADVVDRTGTATGRVFAVDADDTVADVRPGMIRRAVQNLVDNAVKYSEEPAEIVVRVDGGRIEVIDRGEGIPREDLPLVFDRFFRSPKARTRPGNGIGLAIVAQVADAHQGHTWAHPTPGGGATVGFSVGTNVSTPVFS